MADIPLHRRIYEQLRKHISEGLYIEGSLLPSENELCSLHNATRPTIRKALDRLAVEGFITRQQGKGSIVKGAPKGVGILSITGTTLAIGSEKLDTKTIVKPEIRSWKKAFSFELTELEKEVGCIYFERLRLVNGKPVFFDITMIPNINLPRFVSRNHEIPSLFNMLREQYNIEVKGGEQKIMAVNANKTIQNHFQLKPDAPVIQLDRKIITSKPGFCFYSQVFCNAQEYSLYGTF